MKKLFLTLALTTTIFVRASERSVVSSAPSCLTGPLAMLSRNSGSNTPCHSPSNLSSPKSNRSTPGHSRRPSMSLVLPTEPVTAAKTTTGFQVTPPTPQSSTTTSPRTPAAQEVVQPTTPTKPSWEGTVAAYQAMLTAAQNQTTARDWTDKQIARFTDAIARYNQEHPTTIWPAKTNPTDSRLHEAPRALTVFSSKR